MEFQDITKYKEDIDFNKLFNYSFFLENCLSDVIGVNKKTIRESFDEWYQENLDK